MTTYYLRDNVYVLYPAHIGIRASMNYINNAFEILQPLVKDKKDINLWCMGASGMHVASLLVSKFDVNDYDIKICYIRKEDDECHDVRRELYFHEDGLNIMIDDVVETGNTLNLLQKECKEKTKLDVDMLIVSSGCYRMTTWKLKFKPKMLITTRPDFIRYA